MKKLYYLLIAVFLTFPAIAEDEEDSRVDAIAALLIIACLTIAMYFWVSNQ